MNQPNTPDTTLPTGQVNDLADSQQWQLVALTPALGDLTISVTGTLRIGRSDSNDIVLATPQVSRQHAQLTLQDTQLYVQDLGSANGTFINGERLANEPTILQVGDELGIADLLFVIDEQLSDDFDPEAALDNIVNAITATSASVDTPTMISNYVGSSDTVVTPVISTDKDAGASVESPSIQADVKQPPVQEVYVPTEKDAKEPTPSTPTSAVTPAPVVEPVTSSMPSEAVTQPVATTQTQAPISTKKSGSTTGIIIALVVIAIIAAIAASMMM
jgi:predicted component of type VI protein secretion system